MSPVGSLQDALVVSEYYRGLIEMHRGRHQQRQASVVVAVVVSIGGKVSKPPD